MKNLLQVKMSDYMCNLSSVSTQKSTVEVNDHCCCFGMFFLLRSFRLPTSSSRLLTHLGRVRPVCLSFCVPSGCNYVVLALNIYTPTHFNCFRHWSPVCLTDIHGMFLHQVTGSWNVLWMVWTLTPGSIMPSVTLNVCHVTTLHLDSDLRPTRMTQRSSVRLTTPDSTPWNMERWEKLSVYISTCLLLFSNFPPCLACLSVDQSFSLSMIHCLSLCPVFISVSLCNSLPPWPVFLGLFLGLWMSFSICPAFWLPPWLFSLHTCLSLLISIAVALSLTSFSPSLPDTHLSD